MDNLFPTARPISKAPLGFEMGGLFLIGLSVRRGGAGILTSEIVSTSRVIKLGSKITTYLESDSSLVIE